MEASTLAQWVAYFGREAASLFAQYPLLWAAAAIAILAGWKAMEILLWLLARGVRMATALLIAATLAAAYLYLRGGR